MSFLTYENVARSGRFQARVRIALIALAQARRDLPDSEKKAGEETVIREIVLDQRHTQNMAGLLSSMPQGRTKWDAAVAGATQNGVTDWDAVSDATTDSDITAGVASLWKYLCRT